MKAIDDLRTLYHLVLSPVRGDGHAERLESFYRNQAEYYDEFRKKLLWGREELYQHKDLPRSGTLVDLGGGTGSNLEFFGNRIKSFDQIYLIDLSRSLLSRAKERISKNQWTNVVALEEDATRFRPSRPATVVTFSYSLTMIPKWFEAIENAWEMLEVGGRIAVVDFFVSNKYESEGHEQHSWWTRSFWPLWFGADNVRLNPDHIQYLQYKFKTVYLKQERMRMPYLPFFLGTVPVYMFIGEKV